MKNSEIYKIAILAVIGLQENNELNGYVLCEVLYKLTQDWYWSWYAEKAEKEDEAKAEEAKAKEALEHEEALKEIRRVSEAYGVETND